MAIPTASRASATGVGGTVPRQPAPATVSGGASVTASVTPAAVRQEKANKATRRAGWAFLTPFLGLPVVLFYFFLEEDLIRAAIAALATAAVAMLLGPFMLWWAVSGMRRGSRHLILGIVTGFVGAFLTTALLSSLVSGSIGYSLISGDPAPGLPRDFDVTRWVFLSPENPLNPVPFAETLRDLSRQY